MKRKEYVERAKKEILSRVRFHAPIVYSGELDKDVLQSKGVDINLPVFKFEKVLTKRLFQAFALALSEENFNFVLSCESAGRFEKKLAKMKNVVLFSKFCDGKFVESVNKLNINYFSSSNHNLKFAERFVKINEQILNPQFDNYELSQSFLSGNVYVEHKEFLLNGKIQN